VKATNPFVIYTLIIGLVIALITDGVYYVICYRASFRIQDLVRDSICCAAAYVLTGWTAWLLYRSKNRAGEVGIVLMVLLFLDLILIYWLGLMCSEFILSFVHGETGDQSVSKFLFDSSVLIVFPLVVLWLAVYSSWRVARPPASAKGTAVV